MGAEDGNVATRAAWLVNLWLLIFRRIKLDPTAATELFGGAMHLPSFPHLKADCKGGYLVTRTSFGTLKIKYQ
jgi:hypothetical protein